LAHRRIEARRGEQELRGEADGCRQDLFWHCHMTGHAQPRRLLGGSRGFSPSRQMKAMHLLWTVPILRVARRKRSSRKRLKQSHDLRGIDCLLARDAGSGTRLRHHLLNVKIEHARSSISGGSATRQNTFSPFRSVHAAKNVRAAELAGKGLKNVLRPASRQLLTRAVVQVAGRLYRCMNNPRVRRVDHPRVRGAAALSTSSSESAHRHHAHIHLCLVAVPACAVEGRRRATGSQSRVSDRRKCSTVHEGGGARKTCCPGSRW